MESTEKKNLNGRAVIGSSIVSEASENSAQKNGYKANGSNLEHSILPLERGPNGDSIPRRISYGPSITGGLDLDDMKLKEFLDEIAKDDSLLAAHLRSIQQDHIVPQFQRLGDVRLDVENQLKALRARSESLDKLVDLTVSKLTKERDEKLVPFVEAVENAHDELSAAHKEAADYASKVGACHDPENPTEEVLIRVQPISTEESAWKQKVPFGKNALESLLPTWLSWVGTVACGCLIGVSAALASGALKANDLFKDPKPVSIGISCLIGIFAVAIFLRGAIRLYAVQFIETYFLEQTRRRQVAWFLLALAVILFLGGSVVGMDRQGILRAAQSHAAFEKSSTDVSPLVWWLVAAAISAAYMLYGFAEGLLKGRQDPITNAVHGHLQEEVRNRIEQRRSDPDVKEALRTLSLVKEAKRVYAWTAERLSAAKAPFDELIARAEAQRLPWPLEWTPEMKNRVEDARENLAGIQIEMNALINDYFALHYEVSGKAGRRGK